jgi:hypothetical protein
MDDGRGMMEEGRGNAQEEEKCSKICRFERNNVTLPPKTKDSYLMNVRFDKTKA